MSDSTELALRPEEETALSRENYGQYARVGFEEQTFEDLSIPFVALLQGLSPQVTGPAIVEGAKPGLLFNTVTEQVYGDSLVFVPALKQREFIEWIPRTKGGGFVARHSKDSPLILGLKEKTKFGKLVHPESGNDIIETIYVYGVSDNPETGPEMLVIAFSITKMVPFRKWNTTLNMFTLNVNGEKQIPPLFAHKTRLSTVGQTNKKNQHFFNFSLSPANGSLKDSLLDPSDPLFRAALELRGLVLTGKAKAADETQAKTQGAAGDQEADEVF